jgi:hypothetical protein
MLPTSFPIRNMPNAGTPHAKEVIKSIRRNNGADEDMLRTADDGVAEAVREMQSNLAAALRKYVLSSSKHMIPEFVYIF